MAVKLKSPAQIEAMKEAGRVSALALRRVGEAVEPGITTAELDAIAEKVIRAEGGIPAFKGYGGFPGSICASVNDAVVHGIPSVSYTHLDVYKRQAMEIVAGTARSMGVRIEGREMKKKYVPSRKVAAMLQGKAVD